jgi:hypothetical protein
MARLTRAITIRLRKPTTIVLALVPSSDPEKPPYKISLDRHNTIFCNCKSWRYNGHSCRHLTNFREALASPAERVSTFTPKGVTHVRICSSHAAHAHRGTRRAISSAFAPMAASSCRSMSPPQCHSNSSSKCAKNS